MKNILKEQPQSKLSGRLLYTTSKFVEVNDISLKKVLNIGCGYGWFELWAIQKQVGKIIGIEIDRMNLETASTVKDSKVSFAVGSAIDIPFPDHNFDTVVSWEVIEHIPNHSEPKMFSEANRVLKKGGSFYLSTPNKNFWSCVLDPAWWLIGHRHYSIEELKKLAKENDFTIVKIDTRGRWWEMVGMLNLYFSKWLLKRPPLFQSIFDNRMDREYQSKGWTNIFIKMVKN